MLPSEKDQIVPMDDFFVFLWSNQPVNLLSFEAFHALQDLGRKIDETLGEFFSIRIKASDWISRLKLSGDVGDAGSQ